MSFSFDSMFGDDWMDNFKPKNDNQWNNSSSSYNFETCVNGKTWKFSNMDKQTYEYVINQLTSSVEDLYSYYTQLAALRNNDNYPKPVVDPVGPKPDPVPQPNGEKADVIGKETLDHEDLNNVKEHLDPDCDFDDRRFKADNQ